MIVTIEISIDRISAMRKFFWNSIVERLRLINAIKHNIKQDFNMRAKGIKGIAAAVLILSTCTAFAQTRYNGEMSRGHDDGPAPIGSVGYGDYSAMAPADDAAAPAQRPAARQVAPEAPAASTVEKAPEYFYKAQGVGAP